MTRQLTLNLKLSDNATFDNFYHGKNSEVVTYLRNITSNNNAQYTYIWGRPASGRSHLLQACCHQAQQQKLSAIYLPLQMATELSPEIFTKLENINLVCIDDIDIISDKSEWEEAIFHTFNKLQNHNSHLLIAANTAPQNLNIKLADLKSRLSSGITYQLIPLNDADKIAALSARAKNRGLELTQQVSAYLLNTCSRDTATLFTILERLDKASLTSQRKLTIPFVKKVLSK